MFRIMTTLLMPVAMFFSLMAWGEHSNNIAVTTTDFNFSPTTWTVFAGKPITLTITNKGDNEHEWVIVKKGASITVPFDDDDEEKVFWEMEAEPGEMNSETFTAPSEPGTYTIMCGVPTHMEQGMKGILVVK